MSSANSGSFASSFPICIPFLFLLWLSWLGLPKLCEIVVVRADILFLFLILVGILSAFHHWEWCSLWVCHIWPLLCWGRFPRCPLSEGFFNQKWVLDFVKGFFCVYWEDHMVFILQFVNVVYHTDGFAGIEEPLHPWDKSHSIMMYCWMRFARI